MANNYIKCRPLLCASLFLFLTGDLCGAEKSIGDLGRVQQDSVMLKANIERAKLRQELSGFEEDKSISTSEICQPKGIGTLTLFSIYGIGAKNFATFAYNSSTQVDAGVGDRLLCGEVVKRITLNKVEVEKGGKIYAVSGTVTAIPNNSVRGIGSQQF